MAPNQTNSLQVTKRWVLSRTLHVCVLPRSKSSELQHPPRGTGTLLASPFNDKLDVVARLQDLLQLCNPEAVGAPQQDALRQAYDEQVLGVHQELGVGDLDWLRYSYGFRCGRTTSG